MSGETEWRGCGADDSDAGPCAWAVILAEGKWRLAAQERDDLEKRMQGRSLSKENELSLEIWKNIYISFSLYIYINSICVHSTYIIHSPKLKYRVRRRSSFPSAGCERRSEMRYWGKIVRILPISIHEQLRRWQQNSWKEEAIETIVSGLAFWGCSWKVGAVTTFFHSFRRVNGWLPDPLADPELSGTWKLCNSRVLHTDRSKHSPRSKGRIH